MTIIDSVRKLAEKVGADTNGRTIADQLDLVNKKLDETVPGPRDISEAVGYFADSYSGGGPSPETYEVDVIIDGQGKATVNKTYAEIKTAIENNKSIIGNISMGEEFTTNILGGNICDIVYRGEVQSSNAIILTSEACELGTFTVLIGCVITSENDATIKSLSLDIST